MSAARNERELRRSSTLEELITALELGPGTSSDLEQRIVAARAAAGDRYPSTPALHPLLLELEARGRVEAFDGPATPSADLRPEQASACAWQKRRRFYRLR